MARDRASRPEAKPLRLFVAIEIGDAAKRVVAEAVGPWRSAFPKARWVPTENWHVTLKFMGSTYPRLVDWVHETLGRVASQTVAFESHLTELGAFPAPGRARVLWVGLDDRAGRMAELALALEADLAKEFKPERRAFQPHLTVARSDPPLRLPADFAQSELEPARFRVRRLVLFRSHLRRPAPIYEPLETFALGG